MPVQDTAARARRGRHTHAGRAKWLVLALVVALLVLAVPSFASAATYATSSSTGNSIVPGSNDIGNHCDDCETAVSLPFPVSLYGTSYSTVVIGSNGNIQFKGTATSGNSNSNNCLPNNTFTSPVLLPFQGDLRTDGTGGGIFTAVQGTAPHRRFIVEWRTTYFGGPGTANFEAVLYENSGNMSLIYGATQDSASGEVTGVQQAGTSGSDFTQFSCQTASTPSGLRVDYILNGHGPAATTGATTGLTPTSATLNGVINPLGAAAGYHFEYGTTTAYGSSTPNPSAGNGNDDFAASAALTGLAPHTTYHYRIVGNNALGTKTAGADASFTTPPEPPAVLSGLSANHKKWRVGNHLISVARKKKRPPVGTTFKFRLDKVAFVRLDFIQKLPGRKVHGKCVAPNRHNKRKHKCTRTLTRGSVNFVGHAGVNSVHFEGRITRTKKLKPGNYTLVITTFAPGALTTTSRTLTFTIVK
jgi:hypothetical protein